MLTRGVWFRLASRLAFPLESTFLKSATLLLEEADVLALESKLCTLEMGALNNIISAA